MSKKELSEITYKCQGVNFTSNSSFKPSILIYLNDNIVDNRTRILSKKIKSENNNKSFVPHILPVSVNNFSKTNNNKSFFNLLISKTSTSGIYQLYCNKVGKIIKFGIARIDGLKCLTFIKKLLIDTDINDNIETINEDSSIVKCYYDYEFKKFIPKELSYNKVLDEYTDIIYYTNEKMI